MQRLVHAATDPCVAKPQNGSGATGTSSSLVQRWRWKYYPSSIEMCDGDKVGDNSELFAHHNRRPLEGNSNICGPNQAMVQGVDK